MEEVYLNIKGYLVDKYFTTDLVSISQILGLIEDLDYEIKKLKEEIENLNDPEYGKPDAYDIWRDRQLEVNNE